MDLYDGEIRYTDDGIRQLVEKLDTLGIRDETVLVITSDHGEEFYEHEVLGHGFSLYQPAIHVPLIANGPGISQGRVVEASVQIVDLPASLLDFAGTGIRSFGDGRSFAAAMADPDWKPTGDLYLENEFGEGQDENRDFVLNAVRDGKYKLILTERNLYRPVWSPKYDAQELYDLEADPGETKNLVFDPKYRARVASMLDRLRKHSQFLVDTGFRDIKPAALSEDVEADMRALGYLGDE
jgi:arylsulfatase A-like enzyme